MKKDYIKTCDYKGYSIYFHIMYGYTYYTIVKNDIIVKDMLSSKQSAKYNITKMLNAEEEG